MASKSEKKVTKKSDPSPEHVSVILAASAKQRAIDCFDVTTGPDPLEELTGHKDGIWCLYNHNSKSFYSAGCDKRILEWRFVDDDNKQRLATVAEV